MWYNPKYPRPEQPTPPTDDAPRLATLPRGNGDELRITLAQSDRWRFIAFRVWEQNRETGHLWPVKGKGVSIKLGEVEEVIAALRQVESMVAKG